MDKQNTAYKFIEDIEKLKQDAEHIIEYYQVMAKVSKTRYDAYIKEGFTEKQALKLCLDFRYD